MLSFFKPLAVIILVTIIAAACNNKPALPFLGEKLLVQRIENGQTIIDSVPYTIPDFQFIDQDSQAVTQQTVAGKVYIADFFFTSCPSICPKVKKQMKRVYEQFKNEPNFVILSHSIDTKYDTVGRLHWYAEKLKIESSKWHLLTGNKDAIYQSALHYLLTAIEDANSPGGFDHSGAIALIDKQRRIRGLYDGLDEEKVNQLMQDIVILLKEK